MSELATRVWFITGTSTGIGRAVAEVALGKGEFVVATARQPNSLDDLAQRYPKQRLLILPLDVTQQDQIIDAFLQAKRTFGRIDVVLNNAAFGHVGELEAIEEPKARAVFDTNFWGAMRITKEAVKFFRETNPPGVGGRLLQVSSWGGLVGLPGISFYGASKFALEGASESLAAELDPAWNIKATGHRHRTRMDPHRMGTQGDLGAGTSSLPNPNLYTTHVRSVGWDTAVTTWKDAKRSAEAFYKIACLPNPPLHVVVGKDAIESTRKKIAALIADIDTYEALSEGLEE